MKTRELFLESKNHSAVQMICIFLALQLLYSICVPIYIFAAFQINNNPLCLRY